MKSNYLALFALLASLFIACEKEDSCKEVSAPAEGTLKIVKFAGLSYNYNCVLIFPDTMNTSVLLQMTVWDSLNRAHYDDPTMSSVFVVWYKAKEGNSLISLSLNMISICSQSYPEPIWCENGEMETDNQTETLDFMESQIAASKKEFALWRCLGVLPWKASVDTMVVNLFDAAKEGRMASSKSIHANLDSAWVVQSQSGSVGYNVGYFHDPGIPELPDSLYQKCGL